jgi:hypothetical protein
MTSEKRVKCPVCEGMGCLDIVVRSWVDEEGIFWKEYPTCTHCKGERYITEREEERRNG